MKNLLHILVNTIRVTFRRRSSLIVYLLLPVGGILLALGVMGQMGARPIRIGIVDHDGGAYAADLVASISSWGNYQTLPSPAAALDSEIARGRLDCGLIIPAGYSAGVPRGRIEAVDLFSLKGPAATGALASLIREYSAGLTELASAAGSPARFAALYAAARSSGVTLQEASLSDQSRNKGITRISLGYFIMFLMLGAGITSQLILSEKANRTYARICTAPVRPRHYLAGNGLAGLAIIAVQIVIVLGVLRGIVGIETYVPDLALAGMLLLFGVVSVALGMLIAAFAPSFGVAAGLSTLIISPSSMLAGCFWSLSMMPPVMQKLALFMPQRWVLDGLSALQEGTGRFAIDLLVLAAFALTFFLVAIYGFKRREDAGQFV